MWLKFLRFDSEIANKHVPGIFLLQGVNKSKDIGVIANNFVVDRHFSRGQTVQFAFEFNEINPGVLERFHALNRSEEHTSELQSRGQLVCRLLLEKKKHR